MNWRFWEKPFSNVIPDSHKSKNAVATYQAERRMREPLPIAWDEYRTALEKSGLVDERRELRAAGLLQ